MPHPDTPQPSPAHTYNRLSRWYDSLAGSSERKFVLLGVNMLAVQPGERVLEIGCGTGHGLVALAAAAAPGGCITGVDLSPGMLAVSARRLRHRIAPVHLSGADAVHLPFAPQSFDAVFLSFTLELFSDEQLPPVLAECRRVLSPSGRLGVVSLAAQTQPNLMVRLYEWTHRRLPRWVDCRPIFTASLLQQAGFHLQQHQQLRMWGLPVSLIIASQKDQPCSSSSPA